MRSRVLQFALAALLAAVAAVCAQAQGNLAVVQHIAVVPSSKGLSVQITTDRAVRPHLSRLDNPIRIVIDLEGAVLPGGWRRIPVKNQDISEVRASQWKQSPPIARIVVQLRVAHEFSVITTGNKVALWLLPGASQTANQRGEGVAEAQAQTPAAPAATPAPTPVSQPATSYEPVANFETLHGAQSVMAMGNPTVLRLPRGGEIHVCPGTSLSVTPSKSGRDLMLGLSTGTIETHYPLGAAADVILTPDFRILLPGPGEFDMAVSADSQGNTCVRTLPGNTSAAVVSEIMGNDTYQVNAGDQVLFHGGRLQNASTVANLNCGCPLRTVPVMRAEGQPPPATAAAVLAPPNSGGPPSRANTAGSDPAPAIPSGTPVQVEAPFIFRATQPKAPDIYQVAELHFSSGPPPELLKVAVTGPARVTYYKAPRTKLTASNNKPRGFFARVRGFFGNMFR
ncbi:MAG TPA: AMIN domain-containing protein [Terriglobales bacterium]|nr:AMIN domain-containing protein [Terriglobales bacterium]